MRMVTGPRSTASDQPRSPPAASTARYDAGLDLETERARYRGYQERFDVPSEVT